VVYASSIAVSGPQSHFGDHLVNEDDPVYGISQYAMHKVFNEFQARQYIKNYGMSIVGVRPANVTGPDKVRGSTDHVQIMVEAARGRPVQLPQKGLMRLLIHVEDMAEVFVRILLAEAPRHYLYNSGGIPVSLGRAGRHRARVPAGRADHLRRGRRARGLRQLPRRLEPAGKGVRDRVSRAAHAGARGHQRRPPTGGGFRWSPGQSRPRHPSRATITPCLAAGSASFALTAFVTAQRDPTSGAPDAEPNPSAEQPEAVDPAVSS